MFSILFFPFSFANAGLFDILGNIFQTSSETPESPELTQKNSQNMALAEAPLNHDLNPKGTGGDSNGEIVDGSALLAGLTPTPGGDEELPSSDKISTYVVHEGDTLSQIAKMFGVSTNTILWSNDIPHSGTIKVGQQLVILPVSGIQHVVKKGDTIAKLAKQYSADAQEIMDFNGVSGALAVGDTVIIPNGIEAAAPTPTITQKVINKVSQVFSQFSGYFERPVPGGKTQGLHGHNGVDFRASVGTAIVAAAEGTVQVARSGGYNGGYGSYVVIQHPNGMQTLYAHLSQVNVSSGMAVSQGQTIGLSGNTGKSTGPHLHFEVRGGTNPF